MTDETYKFEVTFVVEGKERFSLRFNLLEEETDGACVAESELPHGIDTKLFFIDPLFLADFKANRNIDLNSLFGRAIIRLAEGMSELLAEPLCSICINHQKVLTFPESFSLNGGPLPIVVSNFLKGEDEPEYL